MKKVLEITVDTTKLEEIGMSSETIDWYLKDYFYAVGQKIARSHLAMTKNVADPSPMFTETINMIEAAEVQIKVKKQEDFLIPQEWIEEAKKSALTFYDSCKRSDLDERSKVSGSLTKYQMTLDAHAALASKMKENSDATQDS